MRTDHLGGTLADRLRSGPLHRDELEQLAQDLLGMLASLHAEGTLHRDLNPASVQLDNAGRLHSSKIGAQRAPGRVVTDGPTGSLNYLSPEVMAGGASDVAADLFACGVLLADCAGPDASAPVMVVIGMLTASEPDMRPASATEALALLGARPAAAPPAPRARPVDAYRQTFDKPAGPPSVPVASVPVAPLPALAAADVPTQAVAFPPVVDFAATETMPAPAAVPSDFPPALALPVPVEAAHYPSYPDAAAYPVGALRRRPGRRTVLASAGLLAALAIVIGGLQLRGGGNAEPAVPAPTDAGLSQQLTDLDRAIDGLAG